MSEFTITFDTERQLFDIMITGAWTRATAQRYREAVVARAPRSGQFDMIVDIQTTMVLPGDATLEIEASLADLARLGLRYATHVTTSALAAIQIRRIGRSHAVMVFFPTRTEALDWLASADRRLARQDDDYERNAVVDRRNRSTRRDRSMV